MTEQILRALGMAFAKGWEILWSCAGAQDL